MLLRAGQARHARPPSRRRRVVVASLTVLALVLSVLGVGTVVVLSRLNGNLTVEDVSAALGDDRPPRPTAASGGSRPLNILLIGSDSRAGANGFVGGDDNSARSDTTIVLHLSADRRRAIGVSIPRDSMVHMPDCLRRDGTVRRGGLRMFNEAFQIGGVGCVQRTVERLTGVYIDHFVVVDFNGFRRMVNALGSVEVCIPKDVDDHVGNIHFTRGRHRLSGNQALDWVRVRHGLDDTGDIGRIRRQQEFLAAMARKALSTGVIANPVRLLSFLDAATQSLTLDRGLGNLNRLRKLAQEVNGIGLDNIQFVTVPNRPWPRDRNRLEWVQPRAGHLWRLLRDDQPLPGTTPPGSPSATPAPVATVPVDPARVRVRVLDAAGRPDLARRAAADLRRLGFVVTGVGEDNGAVRAGTRVRHSPDYSRSGTTVATALKRAPISTDRSLGQTVVVEVGTGYSGVQPVVVAGSARTPAPPRYDVVTAAEAGKPTC